MQWAYYMTPSFTDLPGVMDNFVSQSESVSLSFQKHFIRVQTFWNIKGGTYFGRLHFLPVKRAH